MDRALCYAIVVGGAFSLCILIVLNNAPIAIFSGGVVGFLALLRGMTVWR